MTEDANDISRYRSNKMTEKERHAFEKRALNDPFLSEALEGAESVDAETFSKDVDALKKNLRKPTAAPWQMPLRIAASIVILIAAGWLLFRDTRVSPERLALQKKDSLSTPSRDTTSQMLSLAKPKPNALASPDASKATAVEEKEPPKVMTESAMATADAASSSGAETSGQPAPSQAIPIADAQPTEVTITQEESRKEKKATRAETTESAARMKQAAPFAGQTTQDRSMNGELSKRSEVIILPLNIESGGTTSTAFPDGGIDAYRRYLEGNQRMPQEALAAEINGTVTLAFTIQPNGAITSITTVKSLGFGCDQELSRLIIDGPAWTAAVHNGKPISSTVWVSLTFPAHR